VTTLTKAGRYDLREELGRGAMGVVFHGFDPMIGRDVAVKTLRLSEAGTGLSREELIGRFQTEARAAGLLTHPNIVVVFDAGEEEGLFYITMEFVEGRSLQTLIDAHQPFSLPRVMKLMEQVCSALDFAHQHNVVHRDIKPANLMLTADDSVKITDFGTAKILQFGTAQTSHVMGTPSYMSPEQVKGKPVDGRSDIFSLGVILYELMTGEKPFPGQNITTVIYKIINEDPIPPRSLDSSIHPGLSAVITRALSKDPDTRYQSCHELLDALKNYREMVSPEATVRMAPVKATHHAGAVRSSGAAMRPAAMPTAHAPVFEAPARLMPASTMEQEEPRKRPGSLVLYVILLAIIGYAGYRIYPPMLDLWTRAQEAEKKPVRPSAAAPAAPQASPETAPEAPGAPADAKPDAAPALAAPAPNATAVPAVNPPAAQPAQPPATAAPMEKAGVPIVVSGNEGVRKNSGKSSDGQAAGLAAQSAAATGFESNLRTRLAGMQIEDKVKTQVTANTLTLSGRLTPIEHRRLLNQLHTVPPGIRIVDDIEYSSDGKEIPAANTGWVWIRSEPRGAEILLDYTDTGLRTPARIEMQNGQHNVRLSLGGFANTQRTVTVESGQTIQFTEQMEKQ
jgi:eukaryotic-like serine/threonine-protein kinase